MSDETKKLLATMSLDRGNVGILARAILELERSS